MDNGQNNRFGERSVYLEHFQYMLEIEKCRSISAAARSLGLVQTTLSSIVKAVEYALGFPVFQRTPTGVAPTLLGERFLALAWEINVKYEELLQLKYRNRATTEPIRILVAPSVNLGAALPLSQRFYQFVTYATLVFEECARLDLLPRMLQSLTNIGLTYLTEEEAQQLERPLSHEQIRLKLLYRDRFYAFLPPDSPLGADRAVDIRRLSEENMAVATNFRFILEENYVNLQDTGRESASPGADNRFYITDPVIGRLYQSRARFTSFPSIELIKQAVEKQNMVSILTGYAIREDKGYPWTRACVRPLTGLGQQGRINIYLLCRSEEKLRYQERIFLNCVEEYFSSLIPPPFADGTAVL